MRHVRASVRRRKTRGFLSCVVLFLATQTSPAQWSADKSVNTPVCTALNEQSYPRATNDGRGGLIIVWQDLRSGKNFDIYAQRFDALGTEAWTHDGLLVCDAPGDQLSPQLVGDGQGGAIIVWEDKRNGASDIYAQHVSASGLIEWNANGIAICLAPNTQSGPQIVSDQMQGAMIAWQDHRQDSTGYDIFAQHVASSGTALWAPGGIPLCTAQADQQNIAAIADGTGGMILTWGDRRAGTFPDIYAQRVDAFGNSLWAPNGAVVDTSTWSQGYQQLVSDGAQGAIITWYDTRRGMDYDIYAQRIGASGTAAWAPNGMPVCTYGDWQEVPVIVSDGTGGAIIAWEDYRNNILVNLNHQYDIYAQHIDAKGEPLWTLDGIPICDKDGEQSNCRISADGHAGAVVVWEDWQGTESDIFGQHVTAGGLTQWRTNGIPVSDARGTQRYPEIISDTRGGSVVVWQDYRSMITQGYVFRNGPGYDIYMQNLDASGHLGDAPVVTTGGLPGEFALEQNYPNPFNPSTVIRYALPRASHVRLEVFDALGARVALLAEGDEAPGVRTVEFNAEALSSGVYFYRLEAGNFQATKKFVLMR